MVNSESTVALARSKHRIFSNIFCVFKIRITFKRKNYLVTRPNTQTRVFFDNNDGQTILIEEY